VTIRRLPFSAHSSTLMSLPIPKRFLLPCVRWVFSRSLAPLPLRLAVTFSLDGLLSLMNILCRMVQIRISAAPLAGEGTEMWPSFFLPGFDQHRALLTPLRQLSPLFPKMSDSLFGSFHPLSRLPFLRGCSYFSKRLVRNMRPWTRGVLRVGRTFLFLFASSSFVGLSFPSPLRQCQNSVRSRFAVLIAVHCLGPLSPSAEGDSVFRFSGLLFVPASVSDLFFSFLSSRKEGIDFFSPVLAVLQWTDLSIDCSREL